MAWLSKLSQRERRFLYLAVFLISLALIDHFVFKNALNRIKMINDEIGDIKDSLVPVRHYLNNKEVILQEYGYYISLIKDTSDIDSKQLQSTVNEIAANSSIDIVTIKEYSSRGAGNKIAIQFNCSGKGTDMITFLYNLNDINETKIPIIPMKIEKIDLSLTSPKEEGLNASIILSLVPLYPEE